MNLNWQCSIRVKPVDREMLTLMRDSGCKTVAYGIESASPDVLLSMKKKITLADIDETLKITHEVGLGFGGNLIFCDPAETGKSVQESLKWFADNSKYIIRMAMVGFHPGTVIYRDAVAQGQIKNRIEFLEKCEFEINVTDIPDAAYKEIEHYINFLGICIGITGKITSLSEKGNNRMEMETECPHCQMPNAYKKVLKRPNNINWISCRSCSSRYKLPLSVVDEITTANADIFEHPTVGVGADKLQAYLEIAQKPHPHHSILFQLGILYLEQGDTSKSISRLQGALKINPCNPEYHRKYTEALLQAGLEDMAKMHADQAQMLEDAGVENMIFFAVDHAMRMDQLTEEWVPTQINSKLVAVEAV